MYWNAPNPRIRGDRRAVVSALAITPPVFARSGSGARGGVRTSSSTGSAKPSYSPTRAPNATGSAGRRISGTGSSPQLNNASRGESWHHGSTPPGWTEHGEKRGWDGGRSPPGLSRHDHDHDHDRWQHHRRFDWGDERVITKGGNSTPASSNSGGVGDLGWVRKAQ